MKQQRSFTEDRCFTIKTNEIIGTNTSIGTGTFLFTTTTILACSTAISLYKKTNQSSFLFELFICTYLQLFLFHNMNLYNQFDIGIDNILNYSHLSQVPFPQVTNEQISTRIDIFNVEKAR